ncbi:MAG: hypothetical protein KJP23_21205 [Deltaproteobacteria bacterium]|nr:hypothetical protein [Deltaproteobacteria bacterium]
MAFFKNFDGIELFEATPQIKKSVRGTRIAYVAQSAAASFKPAHRLIKQYAEAPVKHGLMSFAGLRIKSTFDSC